MFAGSHLSKLSRFAGLILTGLSGTMQRSMGYQVTIAQSSPGHAHKYRK